MQTVTEAGVGVEGMAVLLVSEFSQPGVCLVWTPFLLGICDEPAVSAMLTAGLKQARRLRLPVYLEASTSDNRRLYERMGFQDLGEPIQLPDNGPSLQPMWLVPA